MQSTERDNDKLELINYQFVEARGPAQQYGRKLSSLIAKGRKNEGLGSGFNSKSNGASEKIEFWSHYASYSKGKALTGKERDPEILNGEFWVDAAENFELPIFLNLLGLQKWPLSKKTPPFFGDQ